MKKFDEVFLKNLFYGFEHNKSVLGANADDNGVITIYYVYKRSIYSVKGRYIDVMGDRELFVNNPVKLKSKQVVNLIVDRVIKTTL